MIHDIKINLVNPQNHTPQIGSIFDMLRTDTCTALREFLNPKVTLVPVPKSSLIQADTLWPSKIIADELFNKGFGKTVSTYLTRTLPIHKSSNSYSADTRPSVQDQLNTLDVYRDLLDFPDEITLIDDVITAGRTSYACALKLVEAFPNVTIRVFAMVRTISFEPDVSKVVNPQVGTIEFFPESGKTLRKP